MKYLKNLFVGRLGVLDLWVGVIVVAILFMISGSIIPSLVIADIDMFGLLLFTTFLVLFASLMVRRLHDLNKSGAYALLSFIPVVGQIMWLYISYVRGTNKENKYGQPAGKGNKLKLIFGLD